MLSLKSVGAVALLLTLVSAQTNYTVDIAGLAPDLKSSWCSGQIDTCGTLCDGSADNRCDPPTLNYTCLCSSNSSEPGLKYYVPSMPNFLCNALFEVCNAGEKSAAGQARCLANQKADCGTIPIADYAPAVTSSSASSSASATPTGTAASSAASTAAASTTAAGLAPTMVAGLGAGVFAVGMAAFGAML